MPKTLTKRAKKKAAKRKAAARQREAPRPLKKRKSTPKPAAKKRRSHAMTEQQENNAQQTAPPRQRREPRGAGSGEKANATRGRNYDESPDEHLDFAEGKSAEDYKPEGYEPGPEYPEGDPAKGKLDNSTTNNMDPNNYIAMRDRRAYLVDQAEKNQAANDELNAIQVEQNKRVQMASNLINDPDYQRDKSMETAKAALELHNTEERDRRLKGEMDARRKREEKQQTVDNDE
jgi:hypothetical protein